MPSVEDEIAEFRNRQDALPDPEQAPKEIHESLVALAEAKDGKKAKLTEDEHADALDWFLSDTDETDYSYTFDLNVGSITHKKWVKWTVKPVDMDRLRRIRKQAQGGNRRERRANTGDFDEIAANIAMVVEGTLFPDLREAARQMGVADPAFAVRSRFGHKPGLLSQIAGEIMSLSGYDDDDVREVDSAQG